MAKSIKPEDLVGALGQLLTVYSEEVTERINESGKNAADKMKKLAKARAPVDQGDLKKSLTVTEVDAGHGMKAYVLHARGDVARRLHLAVHGHAKQNGGRVPGHPFLHDAVSQVLPEYEKDVEEAVKA